MLKVIHTEAINDEFKGCKLRAFIKLEKGRRKWTAATIQMEGHVYLEISTRRNDSG